MRLPAALAAAGAVVVSSILAPPGAALAEPGPTTTLNGTTPPGVPAPLADTSVMLDMVQPDGNRLLVISGVRRAGTRAPIHAHEFGGHTCVLTGAITDLVEGSEPMTVPAGRCYYMPPGAAMTAANLGSQDVVLTDTFILPPGAMPMTVLEP